MRSLASCPVEPSTPGTLTSSGADGSCPASSDGPPDAPLRISGMLGAPGPPNKCQPAAPPTEPSSARSATEAARPRNHFLLLLLLCGPVAPGADAGRLEASRVPRAAVVASSPNETSGDKPSRTRPRSLMS